MSGLPGANTKKRKKTDAKPQSQINKCLNEKRRREQENIFIEELAELISARFADMNSLSVKPDKCAILQETVNQIRHIKQQEQQEHSGGDAAVQQGEVSSSNPTVLRNEVFGPLLLEALDGFLFVVNLEGKIEFVTENVEQFIKYTRDDVFGKSIYNFIHHGDHGRFSSSLLPVPIGWGPQPTPQNTRKTFECRLLVKPPDDHDATMEEKQQRVSKYENMQIECTQVQLNKDKGDLDSGEDVTSESGDGGLSLMCLARRIPHNEKSVGTPIEQFSMKLDVSGKIIGIDTIGVSAIYSQYLNKDLMGELVQEICHHMDLPKLANHLKETVTMGSATSPVYRLRVGEADKYIRVKTVSKFFKSNMSLQEPDFIMATHSIIGESDVTSPEAVGNSPASHASATSVGGPLMPQPYPPYDLSLSEFGELFPTSTWPEVGEGGDSRASLTPRPPSAPVYSPAPAHSFPFSPLQEEEKETREEPQESGRLRNLLTQRSSVDEEDSEARNKHRILKGLLNQEEEEENRPCVGRMANAQTPPNNNNNNNNNNMLLKLLNEKNDDEDVESRMGIKKQDVLLQQLLKDQGEDRKPPAINSQQEDNLLKSLGFHNSSSSPSPSEPPSSFMIGRKRPSDEADSGATMPKRPSEVSSSGNSKLWERNKMLASLLAKEPPKGTTIPPIPTSVISATPQDKLPKLGDRVKPQTGPWSGGNMQAATPSSSSGGKPQQQQQQQRSQFLSQILAQQQDPQILTMQLARHLQERSQLWDNHAQSSDPYLSDILDQVIDIVPDAVCSDSTQIISLLDQMDQVQPPNETCYQTDQLQERMAINAIQKSLMQCETAVKSPSSPSYTSPPGQPAGFPPPPVYQQSAQRVRFTGARAPFPQNQHQALLQRKMLQEQQKQQKQRLLQAQQQQQLLIPSNAAADSVGIANIDSLLNNTVAPNVSLQRSTSVPESQLSPGYSNQMLSNGGPISSARQPQQQQQQQQQPYSPHSPSPQGPQGWPQPTQARLSPHQQSQLSPRVNQGQQTGYPITSQAQNAAAWQQTNRLSMQQQQNPMLNAQLTGAYGGGGVGRFPLQNRVSPGPSPQNSYQTSGQQMRLQRSASTPSATGQLPGGTRHLAYPPYPSHPSPDLYHPHPHAPPDLQYYEQMYGRPPPLQSADYVRQELRAVVGARTQQLAPPASPRQQQINQVPAADLAELGLVFELPAGQCYGGPPATG